MFRPEAPITIARLIARLNESLTDDTAVIADVGDALFAATELVRSHADDVHFARRITRRWALRCPRRWVCTSPRRDCGRS